MCGQMFLQFGVSIIIHNLDDSLRKQAGLNENHVRIIRHWRSRVNCDFAHFSDSLRSVISLTNDVPYVSWTPNLNTNGEVRVYKVMGKTNLTDAAWMCPTNAAHRFFTVKVELP